jgi:hypothetical protein
MKRFLLTILILVSLATASLFGGLAMLALAILIAAIIIANGLKQLTPEAREAAARRQYLRECKKQQKASKKLQKSLEEERRRKELWESLPETIFGVTFAFAIYLLGFCFVLYYDAIYTWTIENSRAVYDLTSRNIAADSAWWIAAVAVWLIVEFLPKLLRLLAKQPRYESYQHCNDSGGRDIITSSATAPSPCSSSNRSAMRLFPPQEMK